APVHLAITCGDPAGVGPEIVAQLATRMPASPDISLTLIGPESWLETVPADAPVRRLVAGPAGFRAEPGRPSVEGARAALAAMEEAAAGCRAGRWQAVVTGPV